MAKYKVLFTDSIFADQEIEKEVLKQIDAELILAPSRDTATLCKLVEDVDAVMVCYADMNAEVISHCSPRCKVIIRTGIGYANVDMEAATAKGIMVANVLKYCNTEVADHAMALTMACLRKVVFLNKTVHNGVWNFNLARPIPRIGNVTMGLYGFGNISREVAKRAKAFDMKVVAYDPFLPDEVFTQMGVERATDLDAFISSVDVLSVHLQLNKETDKIINAKVFDLMKPTAYLINVSRGGLVDEEALLDAIANQKIGGCALDVMATEPGDIHSRLLTYDNVIITPHSAFYSDGSDIDLRHKAAEEIVQVFTQGYPEFWLNKNM